MVGYKRINGSSEPWGCQRSSRESSNFLGEDISYPRLWVFSETAVVKEY